MEAQGFAHTYFSSTINGEPALDEESWWAIVDGKYVEVDYTEFLRIKNAYPDPIEIKALADGKAG